ncbi:FAD-dependent oxidoreductase [Streptomyces regalis]|uniref:FAD-dependent oxidoreductase n=1 Tax=Streptomyces regalis TaxID=68262 RepID=UPI0024467A50|nr:FAD-dependent oxidoreductase [Streptomyces regalis]
MPVVVVGAGIVGASAAYHLARCGAPVTLIDRGAAPATGVTGGSFAWIGGCGGDWPGGAEDLRAEPVSPACMSILIRRISSPICGEASDAVSSAALPHAFCSRSGSWPSVFQTRSMDRCPRSWLPPRLACR